MHVILVSQSTGRALQRARSIIDRFAVRFGTDTWMTPITIEALAGLRNDLAHASSHEMSVACYRNSGMQKMTLLWTVGSRKSFGEHGGVAVATRSRKPDVMPDYVKTVWMLARLSGLTHDLGKMNAFFQEKLLPSWPEAQRLGDPVRHEWLSGMLLDAVWNGEPVNLAQTESQGSAPLSFATQSKPTGCALEALRWAVVTHHKMLIGSLDQPSEGRHWKYSNYAVSSDGVRKSRKEAFLAAFKKGKCSSCFMGPHCQRKFCRRS